MSNLDPQDKFNTYGIEDRIKTYENKLKQDFQDWREVESFSLLLQEKMPLKADFFARQAESLFLTSYPQIERDKLVFENIDWADYIEFNLDLKRASFTKLKAIRHLYTHGIAEGRLGRYLIATGKADAAVDFFTNKILKYPQKKIFYLGYQKLLTKLANLTAKTNQAKSLESADFPDKLIKLQLQLINHNLSLKAKLLQTENSLQQLEYQVKYQAKLNQADNLAKQDIFKLKSLENEPQYPTVGKTSANNVAIAGKSGWFFINGGSNSLMKYHTGRKQLSPPEINQWNQLLQQRIEWHKALQIKYQHIFVPNKIAVYPEFYPHDLDIKSERPILQLQKECQQAFLYPLDIFLEQKTHYRLYDKQDCHWNFWGCYFAYNLICQLLKIKPQIKLFDTPIKISQQKGDLGDKFGIQTRSLQANLKLKAQIVYDNQVINYCHQGSRRILKNDSISHGKMIIFGDSFSNPGFPNYTAKKRLTARLSSLFAETLNEVHFIWTPWIDYDYIEREKPDFVLTEMAERFLVRIPDDRAHLPLNEFAAMKLSQYK
ncbi:MAG TPA: hypothetical protein V6C71_20645 [Coleofasciculaceae cyanobacterium]|jgi:hypothetical protein